MGVSREGTRDGRSRLTLAAGALAVTLAGAVALDFARFVRSLASQESDPPRAAEAIVALTGGSQRIGDAIDLLARGFGARLLITGVNERTSLNEIARLSPGQRDLVACCVDLDYRARNTIGNAVETGRWVRANGFGSLIVVTSNYHMPRTMAELDRALPGTVKVPHPVVTGAVEPETWWTRPAAARLLVSEYLKYVVVTVRNRLGSSEADRSVPFPDRSGLASLGPLR